MAEPVKLPVFATLRLALRWSLAIMRGHRGMVLAYFFAYLAFWTYLAWAFPVGSPAAELGLPRYTLIYGGGTFVLIFTQAFLAFMVHDEILRGAAGFDWATMGPRGARAFFYFRDGWLVLTVALVVMALLRTALLGLALLLLGRWVFQGHWGGSLIVILAHFIAWLAATLTFLRLFLRLPSRALGHPLTWRQVWRMGRGNSWRLIAGASMPLLLVAILAFVVGILLVMAFPEESRGSTAIIQYIWDGIQVFKRSEVIPGSPILPTDLRGLAIVLVLWSIWSLTLVFLVVQFCAFLSLAFKQLEGGLMPDQEDLGA